jgi:hypothetical protein
MPQGLGRTYCMKSGTTAPGLFNSPSKGRMLQVVDSHRFACCSQLSPVNPVKKKRGRPRKSEGPQPSLPSEETTGKRKRQEKPKETLCPTLALSQLPPLTPVFTPKKPVDQKVGALTVIPTYELKYNLPTKQQRPPKKQKKTLKINEAQNSAQPSSSGQGRRDPSSERVTMNLFSSHISTHLTHRPMKPEKVPRKSYRPKRPDRSNNSPILCWLSQMQGIFVRTWKDCGVQSMGKIHRRS